MGPENSPKLSFRYAVGLLTDPQNVSKERKYQSKKEKAIVLQGALC